MKQEQYERAVAIHKRIADLEKLQDDISPSHMYCLTYVNKNNKPLAEFRILPIANILDKHDEMIRKEIQQEIDNLKTEIETL